LKFGGLDGGLVEGRELAGFLDFRAGEELSGFLGLVV